MVRFVPPGPEPNCVSRNAMRSLSSVLSPGTPQPPANPVPSGTKLQVKVVGSPWVSPLPLVAVVDHRAPN